jgi:hypothetical protein
LLACHNGSLESLLAGEQTGVDGLQDRRGIDHATAKVTTVQSLDGIFTPLDLIELDINVTLRVRVDSDVEDVAVFVFGFLADLILQFLDPVFSLLVVGIKHVVEDHAAGDLGHIDGKRLRLGPDRLGCLAFLISLGGRLVGSGQFAHQGITAVVAEADSSDIRVVEGTSPAVLVAVTSASPVKVGLLAAAAAGTRKGGALERVLTRELLEKVGGALRRELVGPERLGSI